MTLTHPIACVLCLSAVYLKQPICLGIPHSVWLEMMYLCIQSDRNAHAVGKHQAVAGNSYVQTRSQHNADAINPRCFVCDAWCRPLFCGVGIADNTRRAQPHPRQPSIPPNWPIHGKRRRVAYLLWKWHSLH